MLVFWEQIDCEPHAVWLHCFSFMNTSVLIWEIIIIYVETREDSSRQIPCTSMCTCVCVYVRTAATSEKKCTDK